MVPTCLSGASAGRLSVITALEASHAFSVTMTLKGTPAASSMGLTTLSSTRSALPCPAAGFTIRTIGAPLGEPAVARISETAAAARSPMR